MCLSAIFWSMFEWNLKRAIAGMDLDGRNVVLHVIPDDNRPATWTVTQWVGCRIGYPLATSLKSCWRTPFVLAGCEAFISKVNWPDCVLIAASAQNHYDHQMVPTIQSHPKPVADAKCGRIGTSSWLVCNKIGRPSPRWSSCHSYVHRSQRTVIRHDCFQIPSALNIRSYIGEDSFNLTKVCNAQLQGFVFSRIVPAVICCSNVISGCPQLLSFLELCESYEHLIP